MWHQQIMIESVPRLSPGTLRGLSKAKRNGMNGKYVPYSLSPCAFLAHTQMTSGDPWYENQGE